MVHTQSIGGTDTSDGAPTRDWWYTHIDGTHTKDWWCTHIRWYTEERIGGTQTSHGTHTLTLVLSQTKCDKSANKTINQYGRSQTSGHN